MTDTRREGDAMLKLEKTLLLILPHLPSSVRNVNESAGHMKENPAERELDMSTLDGTGSLIFVNFSVKFS